MQLETALLGAGKELSEMDKQMAAAVVKSLAVSLFAAQVSGLIKFPAGGDEGLTIGEIESKLDLVAAAFVQKLVESKPS